MWRGCLSELMPSNPNTKAPSAVSSGDVAPGACLARTVFIIGGDTKEGGDPDERAALRRVAKTVASALAANGVDLIVCSPMDDSADFHAACEYALQKKCGMLSFHMPEFEAVESAFRVFENRYRRSDLKIKDYWHPAHGDNREQRMASWTMAQLMAAEQADAIVAIGGKTSSSANLLLQYAEHRHLAVLPLAFLGGAAKQSHGRQFRHGSPDGIDPALLMTEVAVEDIIPLLNHLLEFWRRGNVLHRPGQLPDVFISRARVDGPWAEHLAAYLRFRGFKAVLGDQMIEKGVMREAAIRQAMLRCHLFIALTGGPYQASKFCQAEKELAEKRLALGSVRGWMFDLENRGYILPPSPEAGWEFFRIHSWKEMRAAVDRLLGLKPLPARAFPELGSPVPEPPTPEPAAKLRSLETEGGLRDFLADLETKEIKMIASVKELVTVDGTLRKWVNLDQSPAKNAWDLVEEAKKRGVADRLRILCEHYDRQQKRWLRRPGRK